MRVRPLNAALPPLSSRLHAVGADPPRQLVHMMPGIYFVESYMSRHTVLRARIGFDHFVPGRGHRPLPPTLGSTSYFGTHKCRPSQAPACPACDERAYADIDVSNVTQRHRQNSL